MEDQVTRRVKIEATPAAVWDAITDPRQLATWFGAEAEVDLRLGGAVRFRWPDGSERRGLVIELDPPHRLAFRWRELRRSSAGVSPADAAVVTFTLEPERDRQRPTGRDGTSVTVTESNGILTRGTPPLTMAENA